MCVVLMKLKSLYLFSTSSALCVHWRVICARTSAQCFEIDYETQWPREHEKIFRPITLYKVACYPIKMQHPYQCLKAVQRGNTSIILAVCGARLLALDASTSKILSTWTENEKVIQHGDDGINVLVWGAESSVEAIKKLKNLSCRAFSWRYLVEFCALDLVQFSS